jgi:two-component system cell cycle sensor histidine kinase/response regulator CckA
MKPEIVFGLESAVWPALLVSTSGTILRANTSANDVFGPPLKVDPPTLASIWSSENGGSEGQFLLLWEQAPTATADLKFRTANNSVKKFTVAICTFTKDNNKWFVLQLLPFVEFTPAPARQAASPPPAAIPVVAAPTVLPASNEIKNAPDVSNILLKQKLDCALQLARTVSLDFNNALTSVLGHTSLLLGKAEAGHPWRHSLMEVEKSAARAAEITNELAVFSRQEKETRKTPPANLNVIVNRCVDFFRNTHDVKITWKMQPERDLFGARFDEAKVQQALTKILENAVEAVGLSGSGQIAVITRNVDLTEPTQDLNVRLASGAYVCVEIADNGNGIDAETLPRIFEPFFTTKDKTHRGLGLALVYGIITNHGGGVAVSSQPGAGVSVRIYLPAEKNLARDSSSGDENLNGTGMILVVDDENLILTMAETILTEYGYRVLTAGSGQKAMAVLSREDTKVDLIITDLVMPVMSGRELVERARQLKPDAKILCMSGYVMPSDKQTSTAYLQKPFTSRELLAKVKQVLAGGG